MLAGRRRRLRNAPATLDVFVEIAPDSTITIVGQEPRDRPGHQDLAAHADGRGARRPWDRVRVVQADLDARGTASSSPAAAPRSENWLGCARPARPRGTCSSRGRGAGLVRSRGLRTEPGVVRSPAHRPPARRTGGSPPKPPACRSRGRGAQGADTFRIIGTRVPGVDNPAIARRRPRYGSTRACPACFTPDCRGRRSAPRSPRGRTRGDQVPGVRRVVRIEPRPTRSSSRRAWPSWRSPPGPRCRAARARRDWEGVDATRRSTRRGPASDAPRARGSAASRSAPERRRRGRGARRAERGSRRPTRCRSSPTPRWSR